MTRNLVSYPFEDGKTILGDRFRVVKRVGHGGMGLIFVVQDLKFSEELLCVLKVLSPQLHPLQHPHDGRALMQNELRILTMFANLPEGQGDCFVRPLDSGTVWTAIAAYTESPGGGGPMRTQIELDLPYYVMEYLPGADLERLINFSKRQSKYLNWGPAIELSAQVAYAMTIVHEKGIVHKDLKPNNLFLCNRNRPIVKVIDPGVAAKRGTPGLFGSGTDRYGAPELLSRPSDGTFLEDTQSDVFSLGIVYYELFTLFHPYYEYRADYAHAHINERPTLLRARRADAPAGLEALVAATLERHPQNRPTAPQILASLREIQAREGYANADVHLKDLLVSAKGESSLRHRKGANATELPSKSKGQVVKAQSEIVLFPQRPSPAEAAPLATAPAAQPARATIRGLPVVPAPILHIGAPPAVVARSSPNAAPPSTARLPPPEHIMTMPGAYAAAPIIIAEAPPTTAPAPTKERSAVRAALINDTEPGMDFPFFEATSARTDPFSGRPPFTLAEEESAPVMSSMASAFDEIEELKETAYQPSPLEELERLQPPKPRPPRPETCTASVVISPSTLSAPTPSAPTPSAPTPSASKLRVASLSAPDLSIVNRNSAPVASTSAPFAAPAPKPVPNPSRAREYTKSLAVAVFSAIFTFSTCGGGYRLARSYGYFSKDAPIDAPSTTTIATPAATPPAPPPSPPSTPTAPPSASTTAVAASAAASTAVAAAPPPPPVPPRTQPRAAARPAPRPAPQASVAPSATAAPASRPLPPGFAVPDWDELKKEITH